MVKNPFANAGDIRDISSIPGLERSPGEGHGNPLQYSCLENPMDRGAWQATLNGVTKSQTEAHQVLLSMGFSRQEHWSGLPCPSPGDLSNPGIKPSSLMSPALAGRLFTTSAPTEAVNGWQSFSVLFYCRLTELGLSCHLT